MVDKSNDSLRVIQETEGKEAMVFSYALQNSMKNVADPVERPTLAQMKHIVSESRRLLNTGPMRIEREKYEEALVEKSKNVMGDPSINMIDHYEGVFGIDIPEKLFWEGYVVRTDITREEGSEHGKFFLF